MESNNLMNKMNKYSEYIETASIISLLFGATYIIGWQYMHSYYGRLGIPIDSLELPISFYVTKAIPLIFIILLFSWWSFTNAKDETKTVSQVLRNNSFLLVLAIFYFYLATQAPDILLKTIMYIFSVGMIILYVWSSLLNKSIPHFFIQESSKNKVICILLFLGIIFIFISLMGDIHAINAIEGNSQNTMIINFSWKENPLLEIKDKEFVFITYHEGNYYVINKQKPAPEIPEVYIIPDDQIEYVSMKKVNYNKIGLQNIPKFWNWYK